MAHRVAPRAEADLDGTWLYVAKESASMHVATHLIDSITGRFFFVGRDLEDLFRLAAKLPPCFQRRAFPVWDGKQRPCLPRDTYNGKVI
jgi:hypothetical protein